MHIFHENTHTHGFNDDCAECQKFINDPTMMDDINTRRIWRGEIHTSTDMKIYNVLYKALGLSKYVERAFQWEGHTFDNPPTSNAPIDLFTVGGKA